MFLDIQLPYTTNGRSEDGRITMRADQLYRVLSAFRRSPPDSTLGAQAAGGGQSRHEI